jgi:hypothetical protein
MNEPAPKAAAYHLGYFKARISDFMENATGMRFDNPDVDREHVPSIVQSLSERVGADLSDFPMIASNGVLLSELAKSLHLHYLEKIRRDDSIGPPRTPP